MKSHENVRALLQVISEVREDEDKVVFLPGKMEIGAVIPPAKACARNIPKMVRLALAICDEIRNMAGLSDIPDDIVELAKEITDDIERGLGGGPGSS